MEHVRTEMFFAFQCACVYGLTSFDFDMPCGCSTGRFYCIANIVLYTTKTLCEDRIAAVWKQVANEICLGWRISQTRLCSMRKEDGMEKKFMLRAIELAKQGIGYTNPNPMVGAVIVKDGRVIGEGYHHKCGELHAERNAFASLTESAKGADLYVTLEPCCHFGRTAPCTDAIIEHKIARVFIGSRDPNPKVSGKGVKILREHGIEVVEDVCKEECDEINPVFFHYITQKRPYIVMKYAMTLDGKIATRTGKSKWITGETARKHVHHLRATYSAILCGIGTVLADDPMLNARIPGAHQPVRIVLDSCLRIPVTSKLVKSASQQETIIVCSQMTSNKAVLENLGCEVLCLPGKDGKVDLHALVEELGKRQIDSVFVEGGGEIHDAFRMAGLVDHVCCYLAPKIFGGAQAKTPVGGVGVNEPAEALQLTNQKLTVLGKDLLLEYDCKGDAGCLQES